MSVLLRPVEPADLALLVGGDSAFDDFGPRAPRTTVPPAALDDSGGLAVVDDDGVAGYVSWRWNHWGPNAASRCPMIGVWLRSSARGHGVGRLAQRQLAELFFRHTATNRVEAHTDIENVAEQRALEAPGLGERVWFVAPSGEMAPIATAISTPSLARTCVQRTPPQLREVRVGPPEVGLALRQAEP